MRKTEHETVQVLFNEYKENYFFAICTKECAIIDLISNILMAFCTSDFYIEKDRCELAKRCFNIDCKLNHTTVQTWAAAHGLDSLAPYEIESWNKGVEGFKKQKATIRKIVKDFEKTRKGGAEGLSNALQMRTQGKETSQSAGGKLDGYGIFEMVQVATVGKPSFALKYKDKPICYVNAITDSRAQVKAALYDRVPWILPGEPQPYESEEKLFDEIKDFTYQHLETPKETDYDLIAAWILMTWTMEKFDTVPYLFLHGVYESGKSRGLEVLRELAFRGWAGTGLTSANVYRIIEQFSPTLLLDEAETFLGQPEICGLLNSGYKRSASFVPRQVQTPEGDYVTEWFNIFGAKAMASTHDLDKTTKSRCITFRMHKATRKIPIFLDSQKAAELRNKLLQYRFDKLLGEECEQREALPERPHLESIAERLGSGRLAELFLPLYVVAPEKYKQQIIKYAEELNQERITEMALSEEVVCLFAILECKNEGLLQNRMILIKHIADKINQQTSYQEQWTNHRVGLIVGRLGFTRTHTRSGNAVVWSEGLVKKLEADPRYKTAFHPITMPEDTPLSKNDSHSSHSSPNWLKRAKEE